MRILNRKAALSFGVGIAIFFIVQNLWNCELYTFKSVAKTVVAGIMAGAVGGFVFGLIIGWSKQRVN